MKWVYLSIAGVLYGAGAVSMWVRLHNPNQPTTAAARATDAAIIAAWPLFDLGLAPFAYAEWSGNRRSARYV